MRQIELDAVLTPSLPEPAGAALAEMANAIRFLSGDAVQRANSGHPGMPMGIADVATVLFSRYLKFDAAEPEWPDRDRFVLSAGHGSMLLYSVLHLTGYRGWTKEELARFRQLGSMAAGHPELDNAFGIETTTGPLGQGLATAVGMAIGEEMDRARFGPALIDHRTWVIVGDGCLMEGISQEAISLAGHLCLNRLVVLWDDNGISIDGPISLATSESQLHRFAAAGWACQAVDGHDPEAIAAALELTLNSDKPGFIACRTVIGRGAPTKAGTEKVHGSPLGADEVARTRDALKWPHAAFEIPPAVRRAWRQAGTRGTAARQGWEKRLAETPLPERKRFSKHLSGRLGEEWRFLLRAHKKAISFAPGTKATRAASGDALEILNSQIPGLVGGSADLTGSVNTRTSGMAAISAGNFGGRYLHFGVREHAMAAIMNGLSLHNYRPYGGTFLAFAGYMQPAIRLSALMHRPVVYILTHDSIGLGEDGPTHQPVETLAMLRAMPNLVTLRPCDGVEVDEAWEIALDRAAGPTALVLSRQGLPTLRTTPLDENLSARGGYILRETGCPRQVTIVATGSEVSIAEAARIELEAQGIGTALVSMPSFELFEQQPVHYRDEVLGPADGIRIGVEAALRFGWDRLIGPQGDFIGMRGFGASGPAADLYRHFGITAQAIVATASARLGTARG